VRPKSADTSEPACEKRKNVVHEQEHVLILFVAEILSHGERGERDPQTRARGFVHLAIHETDARAGFDDGKAVVTELRVALLVLLYLDDAGFNHFIVKIVAFARAFTDTGKHRNAAVQLGDVVDEFHDDDGLANAGTAKRADLAALRNGQMRSMTLIPVVRICGDVD